MKGSLIESGLPGSLTSWLAEAAAIVIEECALYKPRPSLYAHASSYPVP